MLTAVSARSTESGAVAGATRAAVDQIRPVHISVTA